MVKEVASGSLWSEGGTGGCCTVSHLAVPLPEGRWGLHGRPEGFYSAEHQYRRGCIQETAKRGGAGTKVEKGGAFCGRGL